MNEVERRGIGKAKLGLAILTILAVILTASNIWVYVNLQNQIDTLETDNTTLYSQMDTLQTDKSSLQTQVSKLQTNKSKLQSQISLLETWLDDNKTLLQTTINERNQLQTWLDDNVTDYESQIDTLNSQIDSLEAQITTLQNEIDLLEDEIYWLEDEIFWLEDEIFWLEWEIEWLKEPQLHRVEVYWADNHPLFETPYIDYYGNIFNSGSWTAYNVVMTVRIYDDYDILLKTEQIHLGNIGGKSYQSFDVDIEYSGDADYITSALSYD